MYLTTRFPEHGLRSVLGVAAGILRVPRAEPVVRLGRGVHDRRGQPDGGRSAAARALGGGDRRSAPALGMQAGAGPPVRERRDRRRRRLCRPAARAAAAAAADRASCRTSFGSRRSAGSRLSDRWSRSTASAREVIGILPPGTDVMDNRTEIWLPIGLNPANRQNRGSHFLYLIGRLKDGVTPDAGARRARLAACELGRANRRQEARIRAAAASGRRTARPGRRPRAADEAGAGGDRRQRQPRDLGAAGRRRVRAADRVRQSRQPAARARRDASSRIRGAHRARSRARAAVAAVHDRRRAALADRRRARPGTGARRRCGDRARLPGQPAAHQRGERGPAGPDLHAGDLGR